jgi:hypothetical protein
MFEFSPAPPARRRILKSGVKHRGGRAPVPTAVGQQVR